tara:strand:+ start:1127 stop:1927 length:801 start_codon:yes stop_codon:yes gene_type:complete
MAYQPLGLGSAANDGSGDDLRTGGDKINDNFVEIYTKLGDGSTLSSDTVALLTATQTMTNKTLTAPTINGVVGGTATSQTITTLTTEGIQNATGELEITAANQVVEIQGGGSNSGAITLNCEQNSHGQKIIAQPHSAGVTNTLTLPAGGNQELVGTAATQTMTNKTLTAPTITGAGAIAGVFTGNITGNVTGNVDGIVGGNTPAAVTGTAISGTSIAVTGTAGAMTLNTVTTTQRNALTAANGMVVYNSTTSKIEAYAGGAWVQLH